MYPGKPCFYLGDGCSIYPEHPKDPCKDYSCAWLEDEGFPLWMKPNKSNVIITLRTFGEEPEEYYYNVTETGSKIDSTVLNWIIHWALMNQKNICYEVAGKNHIMGTAKFREAIDKLALHNQMSSNL